MRSFKKGLALICMLAMLAQLILAVPVFAAAEPLALSAGSYDVIFLSDLHNGLGGYKGLIQMMDEVKAEGQNPRVLSHGGDYVEDDHGGEVNWQTQVYDVISGTEKAAFPEAKQSYTLGNHDFESGTFGGRSDKEAAFQEIFGFPRCGLGYADDELEIYYIGAQSVTGAGGGGEAFYDADIEAFDQYLASKEGSGKVIFLQTHWPGHSSYNFRQRVVTNADKLIDTLNKYGDDMDLVWMWGHNHYEDSMRYTILQPGDEIMYQADTSGSSWGNPRNPKYKTIKFTYANVGCMNDMWWRHTGHNDTNAAGNYRGPAACLSVAVEDDQITFTYNRIKQDGDAWVFSHDADLQIYNHNVLMEHPANVTVDRVAADHTHEYEVSEVVEPTCTEKGYTVEKCKLCDRTRTTDPTDALGHAWDEGVETVPATVEKAGVMTYTCTRCGETRTQRIPRLPGGALTDIDFTDPADEGKFDVENKDTAAIVEGEGLTLTPTADAFEPIGGGYGGGDATPSTPKDLIKVPVSGDWTATTKVAFDQNAVQFAFNSYFAFLAMEGEDYQNMAGIRGTNNVFQDFLRKDGTIAAATVPTPGWQDTPTSGFTATGDYWLRLDKTGTSYTGSWSADGESFTELFTLADTDIDAEYIVLDAYKTSTFSFGGDANWLFTLKSLEFETGGGEPGPSVDKAALNKAIADAEAVDQSKYTDESVAALNAALDAAKAAKSATEQAVIDSAAAALNDAIAALVEKPVDPPQPPPAEAAAIDFTAPADAEKFTVVNKDTAEIVEGEGLTLEWTADAFEPVSAGWNQPAEESAPKDLIKVPVSGDWTATLKLELDRGSVSFAFSSYFAFLAMQGEDYQNMAGVRATNAAAQDFLRENGNITAGSMDSADVFGVNGPYWFRIEKEGTTYTCTLSTDGVEYSDLFVLEDTGIEADYIVIDAYKTSSMSFGGNASYQFQLKSLDIEKPLSGEAYVLADSIEAGKQYVVVADAAYALTNAEVPGKASYANVSTTRGAKAVEIADGRITSEVDDSMLWTFEASTSAAAYDGEAQYWLRDSAGKYLRRGSMSQRNAALILDDAMTSTARYYTWSFKPYADGSGYAMYVNSERAYGSDYAGRVKGEAAGFDIPGTLEHRTDADPFAFMNDGVCSHITLYEKITLAPPAKPAVASISVDGVAIEGFEPKLRAYAVAVPEGGSAPTVSAEPGNSDTVIEVAQAEGVPGEAVITATSPRGVKTYSVCFDNPPKDDYFADGDMNEGQWTILNEVKDPTEEEPFKYYRFEQGLGLVMPTQHNSIYQRATPGAWSNMFTMPGGGDWEVVAKAFYPAIPQGNYQQVQFIAWQDEDNYVRINCQDARQRIEPFYEKNGTAVNQNGNALNDAIGAAEDGSMTCYFKINKSGSVYTISYSEDGKEWKSGGVYEAALTNVKVAVFCTQDYQPTQSNYMEPVELAFEYVAVTGLDGENVRTDDEVLTWAAQNAADYIAAGLPAEASEDLVLSAAPHGYSVELITDNAAISADGKVAQPEKTANVSVQVKVSEGDTSAVSAPVTVKVPGTASGTDRNIDFTNPADAEKFTVDNQTVSEIKEGEGFYMISTNEAIEDCKGQLSGEAANTPRDTVQVPVEGDWTATLYVKVDTSGSNGQYEFLCLYGMADYDNGVGIRAGNGSTVNFKEVGGVNESSIDGMKVQTGLTTGTDHWYRLEKEGTTYTGYLSENGTDFQKVFTYENTGIEAKMIVIDAYSGRSVGYQYWLQSLTFEGEGGEPGPGPGDDETPILHPELPIWENTEYSFAERAADLIARMSLAQKGSQLITTPAAAIPASSLSGGALNVPSTKDLPSYYWWCEALHGYNRLDSSSKGVYARNHEYENIGQWGPDNAVSYPMSLTVGNTWNPDLYYTEALEVGDEIRELTSRNPFTGNAIDLNFYSPTVNLQRDPRWGRNEESYSEDPYLTIRMASQYVQGLEGKDQNGNLLDPDGYYNAHSTIKHYLANNSEANRTNGGAVSSLNALRNYYMAPYRGIIKGAKVSSVMTAYSTFNGEPCSYSSYLMDTLLRQVYGFKGYFTSDCDSVGTMVQHTRFVNPRTGKTLTNVERLATALAHGEDLECIGGYAGVGNYGSYAGTMIDAKVQTDKGLFTENTFDVALMRLMTARIATGEFEDDLQLTKDAAARTAAQIAALGEGADIKAIPYNQTPERLAILDQVNNEGVVMLQNRDNFLPLRIPASGEYKVVIVGAWQTNMYLGLYSAKSTNSYNHINIQKGITDAIKAKNPDATFTYITSDTVNDSNKEAIQTADVVVVVGGANGSYSQEGRDRTSLAMANNQAAMFSQVGKWNPNTIAVMEYQGPLETYTFRDDVKAMLWSSFGGIHKGVGFGNIIVGNVNPSGKLTATWFRSADELPPTLDYTLYATEDQPGRTYMYYEGDGVDYPFGYGLSFTTYEYSNLKIDKTSYDANDTVKVSFDVKNTGAVAGKETAQLYIAQPGADPKVRPIRRLEGFEKVELQPGETKTVNLEVRIPDLAYYDENDDCYSVDTGAYQVQVGKDSASLGLTADFTVTGAMDVYPETLTVKANAVGDTEKGIEERLIYDMGSVINPQVTVAMNNEKLYGYIIADQQSLIKSMSSTPLPAGMTVSYKSNRSGVAKVEGDKITAVGPGVATITATATLDGVSVSTEFIVYVESKPQAVSITLDGEPLEGFAKDKYLYEVEVARGAAKPVVAAVAASDALELTVKQPAAVPGIAEVVVHDPATGASVTYQIGIGYKPVSTDFSEGLDAARAKGWNFFYEDAEKYAFGEDGLTLTPKPGEFGFDVENPVANVFAESALGDWVAETTLTPAGAIGKTGATHRDEAGLIVYGDNGTSYRVVYNNRWNASNGVITYQNSRINVYLVVAGNDNNFSIANASVPAGTEKIHLRMIRTGNTCQAQWSANGTTWNNIGNAEPLDTVLPQVGVFSRGNDFTATFDGLNIMKVTDVRPQLAELCLDGETVEGFEPGVYNYNLKLKEPTDHIPVVTATPAAEDLSVEIKQFDAPTGVATVTVKSAVAEATYSIAINYGPSYDYLADGEDGTVKGKGFVPTAENTLSMPGQGTWAVVAKAFVPNAADFDGQSIGISVVQDARNSVNINLQGANLQVQPSRTNNGTNSTWGYTAINLTPAEDGSATVYFMIDKDPSSYTMYASADGETFQRLGNVAVTYVDPKIELRGVQTGENPAAIEYVAVPAEDGFDAAITDYFTWAAQNVADYIAADLPDETDADLALSPAPHGYTVALGSSDPAVISADGKVTPAAADKAVTVTVTVTEGDVTASASRTVRVPGAPVQPVVDYAALNAAIAVAEAVKKDKYTDETVAALEAALAAAREALKSDDQAAVDAAAAALNAAVAGLQPKPVENPDLEELYRLINEAIEDAKAAQAKADEAIAKAEAAAAQNREAYEAALAAARAAQKAAEQALSQAAAAKTAADASDRDAAGQALLAAQEAVEAAKQAARAADANANAQAAQAAAEAAQKAAEAAQANAAADQAAVEKAVAAAQAAQKAAEDARAAALEANTDAAAQAAQAALDAAEAARAQAAAAAAQAAAQAAQKAAEEAKAQAEAAQANAAADQAAAKAAREAAEAAKTAADNAKNAAEAAKAAAESSNATAAEAAAAAAEQAAKVADVLAEVTAAQEELLAAKAELEQNAAAAQAAKEAAEAAQAAAEAARLSSVKYLAKAKLAHVAAIAEVPEEHQSAFDDAMAAGLAAIDAAEDAGTVEKAREDTIKALSDIINAYTEPFRFDDVKDDGKYYYNPVYWAYEREPQITTGTSDTLFSPDAPCTRAQVVTFLWRAANQPEPKGDKNPFVDVSADAYYYKAVLWAVEEGIAKGTTETTFRPDQTCTRGQIMTFLWRYMEEPAPKSENPFVDVAADAYYADAIAWGAENNIAKGITETEFRPDETCTRGQIVTFLYRAMP